MELQALSITISGCALALTAIFAFIGWRFQRLSQRCHLYIENNLVEHSEKKAGIYAQNNGPGIAIISAWQFWHDGKDFGDNEASLEHLKDKISEECRRLTQALQSNGRIIRIGYTWMPPKSTLTANTAFHLLWLEDDGGHQVVREEFRKFLLKTKVEFTATSIYGESAGGISAKV